MKPGSKYGNVSNSMTFIVRKGTGINMYNNYNVALSAFIFKCAFLF